MKNPKLPIWTAPLVFGIGIPATYLFIYYSNIGINLAHGQQEILEERSLGATVVAWVSVFVGLGIVRIILDGQKPSIRELNRTGSNQNENGE